MPAVVLPHADLPFPGSLPEFQRLFRDDTACATYLEAIRWRDGVVCGWGGGTGETHRPAHPPPAAPLPLEPPAAATGSSADGAANRANPTASPTGRTFSGAANVSGITR